MSSRELLNKIFLTPWFSIYGKAEVLYTDMKFKLTCIFYTTHGVFLLCKQRKFAKRIACSP
jgi:hypothetical protein